MKWPFTLQTAGVPYFLSCRLVYLILMSRACKYGKSKIEKIQDEMAVERASFNSLLI